MLEQRIINITRNLFEKDDLFNNIDRLVKQPKNEQSLHNVFKQLNKSFDVNEYTELSIKLFYEYVEKILPLKPNERSGLRHEYMLKVTDLKNKFKSVSDDNEILTYTIDVYCDNSKNHLRTYSREELKKHYDLVSNISSFLLDIEENPIYKQNLLTLLKDLEKNTF